MFTGSVLVSGILLPSSTLVWRSSLLTAHKATWGFCPAKARLEFGFLQMGVLSEDQREKLLELLKLGKWEVSWGYNSVEKKVFHNLFPRNFWQLSAFCSEILSALYGSAGISIAMFRWTSLYDSPWQTKMNWKHWCIRMVLPFLNNEKLM